MRRSRTNKSLVEARGVSKASRQPRYENTGTFGAFRRPAVVGVSDEVAYSNKVLARRAKRMERAWKRSLPKGVKV